MFMVNIRRSEHPTHFAASKRSMLEVMVEHNYVPGRRIDNRTRQFAAIITESLLLLSKGVNKLDRQGVGWLALFHFFTFSVVCPGDPKIELNCWAQALEQIAALAHAVILNGVSAVGVSADPYLVLGGVFDFIEVNVAAGAVVAPVRICDFVNCCW